MRKPSGWLAAVTLCSLVSGALPVLAAAPSASIEAESSAGILAMEAERYDEALNHFRRAVALAPRDPTLQRNLAVAYHNAAIALATAGQMDTAVRYAKSAVSLLPDDQDFRASLSRLLAQQGRDLVGRGRYPQARLLLQEALRYDSRNANALVTLGFAAYYTQQLMQARNYWRQASALQPGEVSMRQLLKQLDQELDFESKFTRAMAFRFDIRLEPGLAQELAQPVGEWLTEARRVIGNDLQFFPKQQVVVLVYRLESFRQLRQEVPEWVAGRYDGKIRLPWDPSSGEAALRQITWHEYTHAVVQGLTNGRCPLWLNEGLAEWEGAKQLAIPLTALREALAKQPAGVIPFAQLSESFQWSARADQVTLAYEQSYSIVQLLIDRYGLYRLRRLLRRLNDGVTIDEALQAEYRLSLGELQALWLKSVAKTLAAPAPSS
ncbi:MAG: tetratricopeptide repeat protein [Candidatus Omnitrophica bacterium]|nr:tetratricopeptide repeat protein [Candidatus Omnitrophota bacterium]